ncbi:MAG: hypothetical protein GY940_30365 [bacterium]|nr:hypothetical protein [bacterium]
MDKKIGFAKKLIELTTSLAQCADLAATMRKVYFDREFNSGGRNQIVASDVKSHTGHDEAGIASMVTLCEDFDKFCNNKAVTTGDRASIMNKGRKDF